MELGCPKHSAGKWTEQERQEETSVPKGNKENISLYIPLPLSDLKLNFLIVSWKVFIKQQHQTKVLEPERLNYSKIYRKGPAGCERAKYMKDGKANFRRCYCCLCKILALVYICPSEDSGLFNSSLNRKTCRCFFHHREYMQSLLLQGRCILGFTLIGANEVCVLSSAREGEKWRDLCYKIAKSQLVKDLLWPDSQKEANQNPLIPWPSLLFGCNYDHWKSSFCQQQSISCVLLLT